MTGIVDPARELGAFLRTRRERLTPEEVGLPLRRRRRTPGLRREEVAELAGVSVDYVVRLEQGRGLRPSPNVLEALVTALRLTGDERTYLFDLAQQRAADRPYGNRGADPSLARLVRNLSPLPAMLVDYRFDILAWNPEMAELMVDFAALPERRRNVAWLCILHSRLAGFYRDRERIVREAIADLRAAWASHPEDAALGELIAELTAGSEEFARLWEERDVRVNGRGVKRLQHADVGALSVQYEVLSPIQDPDQRLVIYRAADAPSQVALDEIAHRAAASPMAAAV